MAPKGKSSKVKKASAKAKNNASVMKATSTSCVTQDEPQDPVLQPAGPLLLGCLPSLETLNPTENYTPTVSIRLTKEIIPA